LSLKVLATTGNGFGFGVPFAFDVILKIENSDSEAALR
jgi:hypothetical protein